MNTTPTNFILNPSGFSYCELIAKANALHRLYVFIYRISNGTENLDEEFFLKKNKWGIDVADDAKY